MNPRQNDVSGRVTGSGIQVESIGSKSGVQYVRIVSAKSYFQSLILVTWWYLVVMFMAAITLEIAFTTGVAERSKLFLRTEYLSFGSVSMYCGTRVAFSGPCNVSCRSLAMLLHFSLLAKKNIQIVNVLPPLNDSQWLPKTDLTISSGTVNR
jgi:hypothetical protein